MSPATELDDAPTVIAPGDPLPEGTRLRDYEITGLLTEGSVSIVYVGWDHALQRQVALKEFMPASMAARRDGSLEVQLRSPRLADAFAAGLTGFVDEARLLARFDHPSLVKVYRFWEENGTAYLAMPFYEGPSLEQALAALGHVPGEGELRAWLKPVLNALTVLHDAGVWHQNIGPDAIVLTPIGPVLLGLSSAGHAIEAVQHAPAAALKRGYAAIEQYGQAAGAALGPWTDLYALGAVVYRAVTGQPPATAPERLASDTLAPLAQIAAGLYGTGFLAAIDAALGVQPASRPHSHAHFRSLMGDIDAPAAPVSLAPPLDLMQEPFLGSTSSQREITVPDRPLLVPTRPDPPPEALLPGSAAAAAPVAAQEAAAIHERGSPSWMSGGRDPARRMRERYGMVLLACIGVAALAFALDAWLRPAPARSIAPSPAASAPRPAAPPSTPLLPARVPAASAEPAPGNASAPTPAPPPPASPATASTPALASPLPAASAPLPAALPDPTATAAERQARCTDILQKASLERISSADTEFFKKECK